MIASLTDTDVVQSALNSAAVELQAYFAHEAGEAYRVEDLQQVLANWLELSIESLAEDAVFHAVEGDRSCAFNRRAFELQMRKVKPVKVALQPLQAKEIAA